LRGLFVTGTDTGVGKTVVAGAIVAALRARGLDVMPIKPVITGLDEFADPRWPPDHVLLSRAGECSPEDVNLVGYGPAVSPHLAAELAGRPLRPERLPAAVSAAGRGRDAVIVEGVGGLLVPLSDGYDVRRLAREVGLPLVVVARPGLGTINHTLLTLEAARLSGLEVAGVVLTPWPPAPGALERSNLETIACLGGVSVSTLAYVARAETALLERAGDSLPLERWFQLFRPGS
jgi:dethiobiotin synthetase